MSGNRKLGRTSSQRKAMLRGMVTYLFENGKIETTYTRAKEVSAVADSMITLAKASKDQKLAAYRRALGYITKEGVAKKLFDEIAPSYEDLNGGYTQVLKMGPRRGDAAEMAIVRLVPAKVEEAPVEEKKPAKKKAAPKKKAVVEAEAPAEETAPAAEEAVEAPAEEAVEAPAAEAEAPAAE